jgi:hypothetical protein
MPDIGFGADIEGAKKRRRREELRELARQSRGDEEIVIRRRYATPREKRVGYVLAAIIFIIAEVAQR